MATKTKNVKITRREIIKPRSPIPQHLKTLKVSLLDQLAADMYIPLVLFYRFDNNDLANQQNPNEITALKRSEHLRKTLSETLVYYYPLAGRLRNNLCMELSDDGVEFFEARVTCSMPELLRRPDMEVVTQLVPTLPETKEASLGGCPLLVQVTIFGCGGIALGLSFSHKFFDARSMATFVDIWAKIARDDEEIKLKPEFGRATSLFPQSMDLSSSVTSGIDLAEGECVTRRYVFNSEKITALKSKAASDGTENPSRVEAVSGLLWKCVEDWRSKNPGIARKSVWCHFVNMRTRFVPALGSNIVGNLVGVYSVETEEGELGLGLNRLVGKLRRAIRQVKENYAKPDYLETIQREYQEFMKLMKRVDEIDIYYISSWCRLGFYDTDFGWEKPAWVSLVSSTLKNNICFIDTSDGHGIEVWLYLTEQDMAVIETNEEFLAFASFNPSIHPSIL